MRPWNLSDPQWAMLAFAGCVLFILGMLAGRLAARLDAEDAAADGGESEGRDEKT